MSLIILPFPVFHHLPDGELIWPGVLPVLPDNSEPTVVQNEGQDPVTKSDGGVNPFAITQALINVHAAKNNLPTELQVAAEKFINAAKELLIRRLGGNTGGTGSRGGDYDTGPIRYVGPNGNVNTIG